MVLLILCQARVYINVLYIFGSCYEVDDSEAGRPEQENLELESEFKAKMKGCYVAMVLYAYPANDCEKTKNQIELTTRKIKNFCLRIVKMMTNILRSNPPKKTAKPDNSQSSELTQF